MQGRWQLETLPRRYGAASLPEVRAIDNWGVKSLLGRELQEALRHTLREGRQAILLMNRRGYHTFLACESCRHVIQCPQCSISLAYHLAGERLLCHYCGYSTRAVEACPACGKPAIRFGGAGTQKLEDELARLLPGARIARMDADSAAPKHAREDILTRFAAREYDILVGTQMVAKGLDFENVTLVGVVSIDQQLFLDDYRSLERSFGLLTQVVGRAGRGEHPGLALVQTINPYNEIIQLAAKQDYPAFYASEIKMRRLMTYPPWCDLCLLGVTGENEQLVKAGAKVLLDLLREYTAEAYKGEKVIALGPMPARVGKVGGRHRWRLLLKCANTAGTRALVAQILVTFGKDARFAQVSAYADMNPENIL
jgi:primosomal protein N' (replication factor Y)